MVPQVDVKTTRLQRRQINQTDDPLPPAIDNLQPIILVMSLFQMHIFKQPWTPLIISGTPGNIQGNPDRHANGEVSPYHTKGTEKSAYDVLV